MGNSLQISLPENRRDIHTHRRQTSILIVDDEATICLLLKEFLTHVGYEVMVQRNPKKALEIFRQSPYMFDLIISDLNMPGMNGQDLLQKIHQFRSDIPIIFCTGSPSVYGDQQTKNLGGAGCLFKPF